MIIGVHPPRTGIGPTALGRVIDKSFVRVPTLAPRPGEQPKLLPSAGTIPGSDAGGGESYDTDAGGGESYDTDAFTPAPFGLPPWWKKGALAVAVGLGALLVLRRRRAAAPPA